MKTVDFYTFLYDVETTGLDKDSDEIIQISWRLLNQEMRSEYSHTQLIKPSKAIPKEVTDIHGITNSMVIDQPSFSDYAHNLKDVFLSHDPVALCGFNNRAFDDEILERQLREADIDLDLMNRQNIDLGRLYKKMQPRTLEACALEYIGPEKMEDLKERFRQKKAAEFKQQGLTDQQIEERVETVFHDAEFDTVITGIILKRMYARHPEIPTDHEQINDFIFRDDPSYVDLDGKLKFDDGVARFTFGKHNGSALASVAENYPGYLQWMIDDGGFSRELKDICREALKGHFPQPE